MGSESPLNAIAFWVDLANFEFRANRQSQSLFPGIPGDTLSVILEKSEGADVGRWIWITLNIFY